MGKTSKKFNGFYRGKVLDNNNSEQNGKIRIEIYPMFNGIDVQYIPWAKPAMSIFHGSGNGTGCFAVPAVDSMVWCFFEQGDIYQPVYFAEAPDGIHGVPTEAIINYPDRKVIKTDKVTIVIDNSTGDINITASGDATITVAGQANIVATGNVNITGAEINLN